MHFLPENEIFIYKIFDVGLHWPSSDHRDKFINFWFSIFLRKWHFFSKQTLILCAYRLDSASCFSKRLSDFHRRFQFSFLPTLLFKKQFNEWINKTGRNVYRIMYAGHVGVDVSVCGYGLYQCECVCVCKSSGRWVGNFKLVLNTHIA